MREEEPNTEVVQTTEPVQTSSEPVQVSSEPPEDAQQASSKFILIFFGIVLVGSIIFFIVKAQLDKKEDSKYRLPKHDEQNTTLVNETKTVDINETNETIEEYNCKENTHKYGSDTAKEFTKDDLYVKGITLGMTKKDVISKLGKNYTEKYWDDEDTITGILEYSDIEIEFYKIQNDDGNVTIGEELFRINIDNDNVTTSRGIKVGSSIEDVFNAYKKENISSYKLMDMNNEDGEMCFEYNLSSLDEIETIAVNETGAVNPYEAFSGAIQFEIKNGKVSHIKIWNGPE